MLRLIVLLFVIALAFGGMWRMLAPVRRAHASARPIPRMVRCARCDLYLPEEEALNAGEHHYCGDEHRLLGPRAEGK